MMVMVVMMEVLVVIALNSDDGSKDDDGGSDDGDGSDDGGPGGRLLARVLKEGVQFWYNDTSTVKRGGGVEKTFLWKTFEVCVTSCLYLFQARSKFFKHTWLCEFVPL
jgi:hypothetical protein